jgi:DNA-binding PadR family transcriptional regulator
MLKKKKTMKLGLSQQEFLISASLDDSPKHGYAISKEISDHTSGLVKFSASTLYGNIKNMQDRGLIKLEETKEQSGRLQKIYGLTDLGKTNYVSQSKVLKMFMSKNKKGQNNE